MNRLRESFRPFDIIIFNNCSTLNDWLYRNLEHVTTYNTSNNNSSQASTFALSGNSDRYHLRDLCDITGIEWRLLVSFKDADVTYNYGNKIVKTSLPFILCLQIIPGLNDKLNLVSFPPMKATVQLITAVGEWSLWCFCSHSRHYWS